MRNKIVLKNILPICLGFTLICSSILAQSSEYGLSVRLSNKLSKARKSSAAGKTDNAIADYWQILEEAPSLLPAHLELGEIYFKLRAFNRGIELLEPALNRAEGQLDKSLLGDYYCVLTKCYVGINNMGGANRAIIKAAQLIPNSPKPRTVLGDIYVANKRYATAQKAYEQALELEPGYEPALERLKWLLQEHGREIAEARLAISQRKKEEKVAAQVKVAAKPVPEPVITPKPQPPANPAPKEEAKVEAAPEPVPEPAYEVVYEEDEGPAIEWVREYPEDSADGEASEENIDLLLAGDAAQKELAIEFFQKKGEAGLYKLEDLLYDPDPQVRIVAVRALMSFVGYEKEVREMLLDAGDDPDDLVMMEISGALKELQQNN
jgi:tetratricopeptide (TPR) repeat protein